MYISRESARMPSKESLELEYENVRSLYESLVQSKHMEYNDRVWKGFKELLEIAYLIFKITKEPFMF